jgi:tungstate transport system ATP-binding protein
MTHTANLIEVADLTLSRGGVRILDIPSFSLQENEFLSLIGPNGAGKTTLLLAIMGLLHPDGGGIRYRGEPVTGEAARLALRRRIAMVLQEPLLFDSTVYDNVASGLKIRGIGRAETRERTLAYLERFRLAELAQRSARKLSGGESRRVSLARAFAVEPEVIIFDEPFANLDLPTRQALTEDMDRVIRERGIAAILVTHDQSEALRLSNRIAVLNDGRIIQEGSPAAVMNEPVNEFVANFVGMETILEAVVLENRDQRMILRVGGQEMDAIGSQKPGEEAYCCIRPENVTVGTENPHWTSARNIYRGTIVEIASLGPFLKLRLDCGFPLTSYVTPESFVSLGLAPGREVFAAFKATSVHPITKR